MSEPFAKDAARRARDSQNDTSVEKVWRYECGKKKTMVLEHEGHWVKYSDYAALAAERDVLQAKLVKTVGAGVDVAASLAAAVSLLERGGKKAAASDKMFAQMLLDYNASLDRFRTTLAELKGQDDE